MQTSDTHRRLRFALATVFIGALGIGIISPVVPFLVAPYVSDPATRAWVVGLLTSIFALCQFVAAPGLGALSDRYGRRPILLVSLIGTVIGYLIFGIGGALWMLFLGRIIDGLTGGNISTLAAFVADSTPPEQRGQAFGKVGAAAGLGFMAGPVVGGLTAGWGNAAPLFVGAALTAANALWGMIAMPESLAPQQRLASISLLRLNPLQQLTEIFTFRQLRWLLLATFLFAVPFAMLQANFALVVAETFQWGPALIGGLFFLIGVQDILTQGLLVQRLLPRFGERTVALGGLLAEAGGYGLIALAALLGSVPALVIGTVLFGFGDALLGPALGGLISRQVGPREQGRVQGGSQSIQALARVIGPLLGSQLYASLGRPAPYLAGVGIVLLAALALRRGEQRQDAVQPAL